MKTVRELLQDSDPLKHEPIWPPHERDALRQTVLAAASDSRTLAGVGSRSRIAVFATVALMVIFVSILSFRVWSPFVSDVQTAVHFEVRLAEDKPAPGPREAKVLGSDRSVYLHDEVLVDNSDIATARVVQGRGLSQYAIDVKFNASGAEKMREATSKNIGKRVAILLDGRVVMALVIRSPIGASAMVTGNFTEAQAKRIVNGIGSQ